MLFIALGIVFIIIGIICDAILWFVFRKAGWIIIKVIAAILLAIIILVIASLALLLLVIWII